MLWKLWLPLFLAAVSLAPASAQETRHFTFHYGFAVKNRLPENECGFGSRRRMRMSFRK